MRAQTIVVYALIIALAVYIGSKNANRVKRFEDAVAEVAHKETGLLRSLVVIRGHKDEEAKKEESN